MTVSDLHAASEQQIGSWAIAAIARHTTKFASKEEQVLADTDPEALHKMRVGMRRLRSALRGFAPVLVLPDAASDRSVGNVARLLGKLRDYDVLLATLERQALPESERTTLDSTVAKLGKRRRKVYKRVQNLLTGKKYRRLKRALSDWLQQPECTALAPLPATVVLPDLLLPHLSELLLHPGWFVTDLEGGEEALHDLRKLAKRTRYQLDLFAPLGNAAYLQAIADIEQIQETLGKLQDARAIAAVLDDTCSPDLATALPALAVQLRAEREQAQAEWQVLRDRLLTPDARARLRAAVQQVAPATASEETPEVSPVP